MKYYSAKYSIFFIFYKSIPPLFHHFSTARIGESPLWNFNQDLPVTVSLAVFTGEAAFFLQRDSSGFDRPLGFPELLSQLFLRDFRIFLDFLKNCKLL